MERKVVQTADSYHCSCYPPCLGHCYCPCVASPFPPQKQTATGTTNCFKTKSCTQLDLNVARLTKQSVVAVAVLRVCWSYEVEAYEPVPFGSSGLLGVSGFDVCSL